MDGLFLLWIIFLIIGFLFLIGLTVWLSYWAKGKTSNSTSGPPAGAWVALGFGSLLFIVGLIGVLWMTPYRDYYSVKTIL